MTDKQKKSSKIIIALLVVLLFVWIRNRKKEYKIQDVAPPPPPPPVWDGKYWTCNSNLYSQGHPNSFDVLDDNTCRECSDQEVSIWDDYVANYTDIYDPAMNPQPTNCYWKSNKQCREKMGSGVPDINNNGTDWLNLCRCSANQLGNCGDDYYGNEFLESQNFN